MDKTVKTNILLRLFPEHANDIHEFEATYDAVFRAPVRTKKQLIKYIIGFAVFHDLTVYAERIPELKLEMHIADLTTNRELLDEFDTRIRFELYDAHTLLKEYDGAFRFVPRGRHSCVRYLPQDKIKDFVFWAHNQERTLNRDEPGSRKHYKHNVAMGKMLTEKQQIKHKQQVASIDDEFATVSDDAMDKIACALARRKDVKNPNSVLCNMIARKTK